MRIEKRHGPDGLAGGFARRLEFREQVVVVAEPRGGPGAEGHHGRPGECRNVNHRIRREGIRRVVQCIGKNESAFRIRIHDLDGLPRSGLDDVTRSVGSCAWHVLRGRDDADHVDGEVEQRDRTHRTKDRCRARHVVFHIEHATRRLQR